MLFQHNMCTIDRILRVSVGIALLYVGFIDPDILGFESTLVSIVIGVIGLMNIGSAFMGHCPVYKIANLSSLGKQEDNSN